MINKFIILQDAKPSVVSASVCPLKIIIISNKLYSGLRDCISLWVLYTLKVNNAEVKIVTFPNFGWMRAVDAEHPPTDSGYSDAPGCSSPDNSAPSTTKKETQLCENKMGPWGSMRVPLMALFCRHPESEGAVLLPALGGVRTCQTGPRPGLGAGKRQPCPSGCPLAPRQGQEPGVGGFRPAPPSPVGA